MQEVTFTTSAERAEQDRLAAIERQHQQREIEQRESRNADLKAQAVEREAQHARESAEQTERTLAERGRELQQRLQDATHEVASLRAAITTERELTELRGEIAGAEGSIAARRLAEAHPAELDRLARLQVMAALWPKRKALLTERLAIVEADAKRLEAELKETTSLFSKAQAALAKLLGRGATA